MNKTPASGGVIRIDATITLSDAELLIEAGLAAPRPPGWADRQAPAR